MDIRKINRILMRTVAALLFLVLVTTSMISGRYARYVTTATYEDSARVARFNIMEEGALVTNMRANIAPGITKETIVIKNYSEVALKFTLTINNVYQNIPLQFQLAEVTKTQNGDVIEETSQILLESGTVTGTATLTGTVGPVQQEKEIQLWIYWPVDATNINYCGRVDLLQVTVDVVQVD